MGARTPDAYRIGAGQVTQEYPADAVPARLRKQPSLPTMSCAPESAPVEQVVTAEVAVVRRKASVPPRESKEARPSKEPAAAARRNAVARDAVPVQAAPAVESPAPAREYAHLDEAGVAFVCHEEATDSLGASLARIQESSEDGALPARIVLIVGPEGGIGAEETAQLVDAGARTIGLGDNVLRSSTAGAVALTLIRAAAGKY